MLESIYYDPNNVGDVVKLTTRPISKETTETFHEKLTIAEETGNVFTDTYYRIGGHVNDDLALQCSSRVGRQNALALC